MTRYVALLRAVNVGGTGKLPMSQLRAMCCDAGFARVMTYIASGNALFDSKSTAAKVKAELEERLLAYAGKRVTVVIRSAREMQEIVDASPFPNADPKLAYAIFLDTAPPPDTLARVSGKQSEELRLGEREIFVYYPEGMSRSKLRIPAADSGTARNMNTVVKLAELASKQ